jgi:hypothetical protein
MKKILLLFAVIIGCTIHSQAQMTTIPNYTKVLELTNKVNKRKAPNSSSPKLMAQCSANWSFFGYTWGNIGGNYQYYPAHSEPDILWVIDETTEWYHGYYGEPEEMIEVYVSKSAAKVKRPVIDRNYVDGCDFEATYTIKKGGKYNGYCIIYSVECQWQEREEIGQFLFIGKNVDGICIGKCFSSGIQHEGWAVLPTGTNVSNLTDNQIDHLMSSAPSGTVVLLPANYTCHYPGETYYWQSFKDFYFKDSPFN